MKLLKRIWKDIKDGENLDLYLTVAIALPLSVLSIIGVAPQIWIAPLTLTVLALIAISLLVNRRKMEAIREQNIRVIETIRRKVEEGSKLRYLNVGKRNALEL